MQFDWNREWYDGEPPAKRPWKAIIRAYPGRTLFVILAVILAVVAVGIS